MIYVKTKLIFVLLKIMIEINIQYFSEISYPFTPENSYGSIVMLRSDGGGTPLVYLPGNHDEFARTYCGTHAGGLEFADKAIHEAASEAPSIDFLKAPFFSIGYVEAYSLGNLIIIAYFGFARLEGQLGGSAAEHHLTS